MPEKTNLETRTNHKCIPRQIKFFNITQYQCGCGRYFTKEQYKKYLKGKYHPKRNITLD